MVGVAEDEVDTLDAFFHHVVDGIASTTAYSDNLDIVGLLCVDGLKHHIVAVVDIRIVFCHSLSD